MKLRSPFVFSGLVLALVGYGINVADVSIGAKYFGTYLVAVGAYLSAPMELTWYGSHLALCTRTTCTVRLWDLTGLVTTASATTSVALASA